jgi:hypothetical protein
MGQEEPTKETMMQIVGDLLTENPHPRDPYNECQFTREDIGCAQAAYRAIRGRGQTEQFAREEIARALLGSMWESVHKKIPEGRFAEVCRQLESGSTTAEIWLSEEAA